VTLNTTRLQILREVSSRGTITAAAKALYLTPPAVSHQLAVLEREVGVPLLQRTARSIQLTGAGRRLVEHADTILADCEVALADVESFAAEVSGTVRLSIFQTAAQSIALPAMVALRTQYPRLEVIANDLEPTLAIPALKSAQLDIALSHEWDYVPLPKEPGLDRFPLLAEPIYALLPDGHPLAGGPVHLADLAEERWCVAKESAASRRAVNRITSAAGFEPNVVMESNYFRAIGAAVEAGVGVGIAPQMTDLRGLNLVIQPLVDPAIHRRVMAVVRKGSGGSPTIRAVLDAMLVAAESAAASADTDYPAGSKPAPC
jgi:DNA-binding transcriptional LysR family regulator